MSDTYRWQPANPLDLAHTIQRYTRWGHDPANIVHDRYLYSVSSAGTPYRICQLDSGEIEIESESNLEPAVEEIKFRLGETLPVEPVQHLAKQIPALYFEMSSRPGFRPPINPSKMAMLVSSICAQQVNLSWAATTRRRIVERYGSAKEWKGVKVWEFPRPQVLAQADPGEIRNMQITTRKSEYIVGTAQAICSGQMDGLEKESNQEVINRLTNLRGIGRWTADWFLARCLARPDVIPAGDLGVRKAISWLEGISKRLLTEEEVRKATSSWGMASNLAIHILLEALYNPD